MLSNHTLIPHFTLTCKPRLEDTLYQRLKEWVAQEDEYIVDNYDGLKEKIRMNHRDNEELQ